MVDLQICLMLIRPQVLILNQGELKLVFQTLSVALSLTSSIIFYFNVIFTSMLILYNLTQTLQNWFLQWLILLKCYDLRSLGLDKRTTLVLEKYKRTRQRALLQNSLPYILLQMVYAKYCAPYPKWPCVRHEVNMWYLYCITSLCSRIFYFFLFSLVINVVIIPSDMTDVTAWLITSNPNPWVLKIEKMENKSKRKFLQSWHEVTQDWFEVSLN